MASEVLSPKVIGNEFVRHYYTMLHENPKELPKLYGNESVFLHADDNIGSSNDDAVVGQEDIAKKIESLELSHCFSVIRQVDCQPTVDDCILIQVSGSLSRAQKPWRTFLQSILLAQESQNKYYVRNDIFRYQPPNKKETVDDEIDNEEVEELEEVESIKDTSEIATLEPVIDQTNESEDNARNEDQSQNAEKHSTTADKNDDDAAEEEKLEGTVDQNDKVDEESDMQQQDSTDEKSESAKKDTGAPSWAALASKSPHVPTDGETARKKVTRKPVENISKSLRSNHHNKDDSPSQRSNNFRNTSQRDGQQTDHQIFIGGLNADVSEKELRNEFSVFGEVKHIKTNISKGFGFVSFENEESVKKALSADFKIFVGKTQINIEEKKSSNVRYQNRPGREGGQRYSGFHNKSNKGGNYRGGERGSGRRQDRN